MAVKLNPFTNRLQLGSTGSGSGGITNIAGNTGTATGTTVNLKTSHTTAKFIASGDTVTLDFDGSNLLVGSDGPSLTGVQNIGFGKLPLNSAVSAAANTCVGWAAGNSIVDGSGNCSLGANALLACVDGLYNVAIGLNALSNFNATSLIGNIGVGQNSLNGIGFTGDGNICIGQSAGNNYVANESNNICLSHDGVPGDQNTIRLGDQGTGDDQQDKCFIAGIAPVTLAGSSPVGINASGQMSNLGFGTSGQILTSNGVGTSPTWQTAASGGFTQVVQQVFTTSGTYTPTVGMKYCVVEAVGGGGGGGGCEATTAGQYAAAGGGSGGTYSRRVLTAAQIGASQVRTIGAGGAGGVLGLAGSNGSATTLGSLVVANNGIGGAPGISSTMEVSNGGTGNGGGGAQSFNARGFSGAPGKVFSSSSGYLIAPGSGGGTFFGEGGQGIAFSNNSGTTGAFNGNPSQTPGGGGSGGLSTDSQAGCNGGAGAAGLMIITEYI